MLTTKLPAHHSDQQPLYSQNVPAFRLGRRQWLTGLRGIAVSCVVLFHVGNIVYDGGPMLGGYVRLSQGYLGVDIFFVLSGFLITGLLIEEWDSNAQINLRAFYIRRGLRLLPALFMLLIATIAFDAATSPYNRVVQTIIAAGFCLGYGTNWLIAFQLYPDDQLLSHTWSLAIEEQFYLAWPLTFIGLMKVGLKQRTITTLTTLIIVAILISRVSMFRLGFPFVRIYNGTDTRADSLLIGCLTAMLIAWDVLPMDRWFQRALAIAAFLAVIGIGTYLTGHNIGAVFSWGFTTFAIGIAVVIIYMIRQPSRLALRFLECRPLVWLGEISYGVYLWHLLAINVGMRWVESKALVGLIAIVLSVVFAFLSYSLIERPFLRLKKRYSAALPYKEVRR